MLTKIHAIILGYKEKKAPFSWELFYEQDDFYLNVQKITPKLMALSSGPFPEINNSFKS
jgi:hypothetical protein